MPKPTTESFEQMTLEVSDNGTTWTKLCGLVGVTINRSTQMDSTEIPADCIDESLPLQVEKSVRSIDVTVSADGVYAQQSHKTLSDWFYSGATKMVRVGHAATLTGDPQYEQGPARLSGFNHTRAKGTRVATALEISFDGTPTRVAKA